MAAENELKKKEMNESLKFDVDAAEKDEKTGQVVTTVGMPEFPGMDKVLEAAEKMYAFVNTGSKK